MGDGDKKGHANQPTEWAGQITEHTQPKDSLQTGKGTKRGMDKEKTAKGQAEVLENQPNRMGAGKVPASRGHLTP